MVFHKFFRVTNGIYWFLFLLAFDKISVIVNFIGTNLNFMILQLINY